MIPFVPTDSLVEYGHLSGYLQPPTHDQQLNGVVPLDSLPASWWNWLWNKVTSHVNVIGQKFDAVCEEINNVLAEAGITPSSEATSQLASAIKLMGRNIATANMPGAVISSNNPGAVKVDSDGKMTVNKFGDYSCLCTTDTTSIVAAINESYSLASDTAVCIPDIYNCIGNVCRCAHEEISYLCNLLSATISGRRLLCIRQQGYAQGITLPIYCNYATDSVPLPPEVIGGNLYIYAKHCYSTMTSIHAEVDIVYCAPGGSSLPIWTWNRVVNSVAPYTFYTFGPIRVPSIPLTMPTVPLNYSAYLRVCVGAYCLEDTNLRGDLYYPIYAGGLPPEDISSGRLPGYITVNYHDFPGFTGSIYCLCVISASGSAFSIRRISYPFGYAESTQISCVFPDLSAEGNPIPASSRVRGCLACGGTALYELCTPATATYAAACTYIYLTERCT